MVTNAKELYHVKVILNYLPTEEYELIPQETIDYIEENLEYDESFSIDPEVPLDKQNIDEFTFKLLDKIIKKAENNQKKAKQKEVAEYINNIKESNGNYNAKIQVVQLKNTIDMLKNENSKIPKAKELLVDYKNVVKQKEEEIRRLKEYNQYLYDTLQKVPRFLRKIILNENEIKMLNK